VVVIEMMMETVVKPAAETAMIITAKTVVETANGRQLAIVVSLRRRIGSAG
jgi:hypothetical protein